MGHGITETDKARYHRKPAWHKLGTVTQEAETPTEAMEQVAPWEVLTTANLGGTVGDDNVPVHTDEVKLTVRSDTHAPLGIVGKNYQPLQNSEHAQLMEEIAGPDRALTTESCFTLHGGRRVVLVVKSRALELSAGEVIQPYLMAANSHDGTLALTLKDVPFRPECANMLSMALSYEDGKAFRIEHKSGMANNIEAMREALGVYQQSVDRFAETAENLMKVTYTRQEFSDFLDSMYGKVFGVDVEKIKQGRGASVTSQNKYNRSMYHMQTVLNKELDAHPDRDRNAWMGLNAMTNLIQSAPARQRQTAAVGKRSDTDIVVDRDIFGKGADQSVRAMEFCLEAGTN